MIRLIGALGPRVLTICMLLVLALSSQAEDQYNSIPSMKEAYEDISAAAGIHVNSDHCTSINKVILRPPGMVISYECPVPESSRPELRSAFLSRGWVPEEILDGAMSKFRKLDQTASLYCAFNAATCKLRFAYAPKKAKTS
jgi:hypothetical protein